MQAAVKVYYHVASGLFPYYNGSKNKVPFIGEGRRLYRIDKKWESEHPSYLMIAIQE
jgi:hypothetical protein